MGNVNKSIPMHLRHEKDPSLEPDGQSFVAESMPFSVTHSIVPLRDDTGVKFRLINVLCMLHHIPLPPSNMLTATVASRSTLSNDVTNGLNRVLLGVQTAQKTKEHLVNTVHQWFLPLRSPSP